MSDFDLKRTGGYALLQCTECEKYFETSMNVLGGMEFDGVRKHGEENHQDERWNYEIIDKAPNR